MRIEGYLYCVYRLWCSFTSLSEQAVSYEMLRYNVIPSSAHTYFYWTCLWFNNFRKWRCEAELYATVGLIRYAREQAPMFTVVNFWALVGNRERLFLRWRPRPTL